MRQLLPENFPVFVPGLPSVSVVLEGAFAEAGKIHLVAGTVCASHSSLQVVGRLSKTFCQGKFGRVYQAQGLVLKQLL